jgi:hypothetical protein
MHRPKAGLNFAQMDWSMLDLGLIAHLVGNALSFLRIPTAPWAPTAFYFPFRSLPLRGWLIGHFQL